MKKIKYCPRCRENVKVKKINHVQHVILSILTGGIWLLPYLMVATSREVGKCPNCGGDL